MKKLFTLLSFLFVMIPASLHAQDLIRQKLKFAPGKTQATITSEIAGRETIDYVIGAKRSQTISIRFAPTNTMAFFNLLAPGGEALFVGQDQGNPGRFTARLGATGDYTIRVYLVRAAARRGEMAAFNLSVAITGGAPEPAPAPDPGIAEDGGPDYYEVTGLTSGDVLNMRRGPSRSQTAIATFRNGKVLQNLGCSRIERQRWCKVQNPAKPSQIGWVNGRYLRESGGPVVSPPRPDDAVVPGTDFHATGELDCAIAGYPSVRSCEFGVLRKRQDRASVVITLPDGDQRVLDFSDGSVRPRAAVSAFRFRQSGDSYFINFDNGQERYTVVDAIINGG